MAGELHLRAATGADLAGLAELRWKLKTEDSPADGGDAFLCYEAAFLEFERAGRLPGEIRHWVAEMDGALVGAMSVVMVRKVTSLDGKPKRWGYLTNCFVEEPHRGAGVGRRLLAAVQGWSREEGLEFLVVWPSERAFPFYEREGFRRPEDVLVWQASQVRR